MDQIDLLLVLAQSGVLGLAIAALGFCGRHTAFAYTGSLILMLAGCSTSFILVVSSFLDPLPRKETPLR